MKNVVVVVTFILPVMKNGMSGLRFLDLLSVQKLNRKKKNEPLRPKIAKFGIFFRNMSFFST